MIKPKKCPVCQSTKFTSNKLGDMACQCCGYVRLSPETLKAKQDEEYQKRS